jgi:hypothetical protein
MSTAYLVPLQPMAQSLTIALGGVDYNLTLRWDDTLYAGGLANPCWLLDIADQNDNDILVGIPLVTGCNLLEQYDYLDFGGALVAQTSNDPDEVPTYTTLGSTGNLYFITNP